MLHICIESLQHTGTIPILQGKSHLYPQKAHAHIDDLSNCQCGFNEYIVHVKILRFQFWSYRHLFSVKYNINFGVRQVFNLKLLLPYRNIELYASVLYMESVALTILRNKGLKM